MLTRLTGSTHNTRTHTHTRAHNHTHAYPSVRLLVYPQSLSVSPSHSPALWDLLAHALRHSTHSHVLREREAESKSFVRTTAVVVLVWQREGKATLGGRVSHEYNAISSARMQCDVPCALCLVAAWRCWWWWW
jgi:hypothetical protein